MNRFISSCLAAFGFACAGLTPVAHAQPRTQTEPRLSPAEQQARLTLERSPETGRWMLTHDFLIVVCHNAQTPGEFTQFLYRATARMDRTEAARHGLNSHRRVRLMRQIGGSLLENLTDLSTNPETAFVLVAGHGDTFTRTFRDAYVRGLQDATRTPITISIHDAPIFADGCGADSHELVERLKDEHREALPSVEDEADISDDAPTLRTALRLSRRQQALSHRTEPARAYVRPMPQRRRQP